MESIDFLIYSLIIVLVTAITICIIYQILKYAAKRESNFSEQDITLLPLHKSNLKNDVEAGSKHDTYKPKMSTQAKRKYYVTSKVDKFIRLSITRSSMNFRQFLESFDVVFEFTITDKDAVIQAGAVPYFVKLSSDPFDSGLRINGLYALHNLSMTDSKKSLQTLIEENCIPLLINGLSNTESKISESSAITLGNIRSKCDEQFYDYIDSCLIPAIVKLLKSQNKDNWIQAAKIVQLVSQDLIWNAIIKSEIIPLLVNLLKSQNLEVCKIPLSALAHLSKGKLDDKLYNFEGKNAVIAAGVLPYLVNFLRSSDQKMRELAIGPLMSLSLGTLEQKQAAMDAQVVSPLIELLSSEDNKIRINATGVLLNLSSVIDENKDLLVACPQVIKNLYSNDKALIFASFLLLKNISYGTSNQCQAIFEANVIFNLKHFLNSEDLKVVQLTLVILDNISDKLSGSIKDIATTDVVQQLIKLLNVKENENSLNDDLSEIPKNSKTTIIHIDDTKFLTDRIYELVPKEIQKRAIKILSKIASGSIEQRRMIIQSNAIPEIVKLLNSPDTTIHNLTVKLLDVFAKNVAIDEAILIKANSLEDIVKYSNSRDNEKMHPKHLQNIENVE